MIYRVRITPRARRDLARLADFMVAEPASSASRAKAAIWSAIKSLDRYPDRGVPSSVPNVRELFIRLGRNGYVIEYLVEFDEVAVLRIFHALEDR